MFTVVTRPEEEKKEHFAPGPSRGPDFKLGKARLP